MQQVGGMKCHPCQTNREGEALKQSGIIDQTFNLEETCHRNQVYDHEGDGSDSRVERPVVLSLCSEKPGQHKTGHGQTKDKGRKEQVQRTDKSGWYEHGRSLGRITVQRIGGKEARTKKTDCNSIEQYQHPFRAATRWQRPLQSIGKRKCQHASDYEVGNLCPTRFAECQSTDGMAHWVIIGACKPGEKPNDGKKWTSKRATNKQRSCLPIQACQTRHDATPQMAHAWRQAWPGSVRRGQRSQK